MLYTRVFITHHAPWFVGDLWNMNEGRDSIHGIPWHHLDFAVLRKVVAENMLLYEFLIFNFAFFFTLWWTNIAMENHHFEWENPL